MGIFLTIVILLFLLWPTITKWIRRYMANKAEDFLRNATGMPPRPGSRKAKKEAADCNSNSYYDSRDSRSESRRKHRYSPQDSDGPIIPTEYAEDVEFVETKEFSQTTIDSTYSSDGCRAEWHESQVSDAEWEEIKPKRK